MLISICIKYLFHIYPPYPVIALACGSLAMCLQIGKAFCHCAINVQLIYVRYIIHYNYFEPIEPIMSQSKYRLSLHQCCQFFLKSETFQPILPNPLLPWLLKHR